jgi:hypothetical protein
VSPSVSLYLSLDLSVSVSLPLSLCLSLLTDRYSKGPSAFGEDYFEGLQDGDVMIGDGGEYDL